MSAMSALCAGSYLGGAMSKQIIFRLHDFVDIPQAVIDDAPASGAFDDYAEQIMTDYKVICDPEQARKALKLYGAWDDQELANHDDNLRRLLWIAVLDCQEQNVSEWYMGGLI